jgi:DNA adenine methylase
MDKRITPVSCAAYPGSKVQFVQRAAKFFRIRPCQTLLEPFAGSGVVGLSLLHAGIIEKLILVEFDARIACILRGLITEADLAERIERFVCTQENVLRLLATEHSAFRYIVQSRTVYRNRFGRCEASQYRDVAYRWCPDYAAANIRLAYAMRDRITVIQGNAFAEMPKYAADLAMGCFADPPYSADPRSKGHMVYLHHKIDHPKLFSMLRQWQGPWLMTQDNTPAVRRLAACYAFKTKRRNYWNADSKKRKELVIYRSKPTHKGDKYASIRHRIS